MPAKLIYLSLGSNLGDREAMIARAVEELARAGVTPLRLSSLYATEPVGFLAQPWFLNCVLKAETKLTPPQLLRVVQQVEKDQGRERTTPGGPRTIDIDILLYGSSVIRASTSPTPTSSANRSKRFRVVPGRIPGPSGVPSRTPLRTQRSEECVASVT